MDASIGREKRAPESSGPRAGILFVLLLAASACTYAAVRDPRLPAVADRRAMVTSLATIAGPFSGAIARDYQRCCLSFSARIAALCAPVLVAGLLVQGVTLPSRRAGEVLRVVGWTVGWSVWLLGGLASLLHALS